MPAKPFAVESAVQSVIDHLAEGDSKFAKLSRPTSSSPVRLPNSTAVAISIASMAGRTPKLSNRPLVRSPVGWYFFSDDPQQRRTAVSTGFRVQAAGRSAPGYRETCARHPERQKEPGLAGGDRLRQDVHDGQRYRPHQQANLGHSAQQNSCGAALQRTSRAFPR